MIFEKIYVYLTKFSIIELNPVKLSKIFLKIPTNRPNFRKKPKILQKFYNLIKLIKNSILFQPVNLRTIIWTIILKNC